MSKTKNKNYLRRVGDTGSTSEIRDLLRDYTVVGQAADIWDRLSFLQRQYSLTLRNACETLDKGDPEGFFKAVGKALLRAERLRMKMRKLLEQMPSREAYEQDKERILTILEEVVPGSRDKIIQGMKKRRKPESKQTR